MLRFVLFSLFVFLQFQGFGQNVNKLSFHVFDNGKKLSKYFNEVEKNFLINVINEDKSINDVKIIKVFEDENMIKFLSNMLPNHFVYAPNETTLVILNKNNHTFRQELQILFTNNGHVKGKILSLESEDPIIGANIFFPKTSTGTTTDIDGKFNFDIKGEIARGQMSYTGFETKDFVVLNAPDFENQDYVVTLNTAADLLSTVKVVAEKADANVSNQKTGVEKLKIETIKQLPTFFGEVDPIKGLTALPGVSTTGDLGAGFNVRGGDNSQNLIIQDGALVFNPTHLFGFFSAFNPDFLQSVTLSKGGGPSKYGGRVSSVLDVQTRNGSMNKFKMSGGVGLISSRITAEGPIKKNKSSFLLGVRGSYSSWFVKYFEDIRLKKSFAQFYDGSAKYFQEIDDKNFVSVTGYYSQDKFNLGIDSTYQWSTKNVSAKWDHLVNDQNRIHVLLASSNYDSGIVNEDALDAFEYKNSMKVLTLNYQQEIESSEKFKFEFGLQNNFYNINPGTLTPSTSQSLATQNALNEQNVLESALFFESNLKLNEKWAMNVGLRNSHFLRLGQDVIYDYDYGIKDGRTPLLIDSTSYGSGEIVDYKTQLEPRVSFRYLWNKTTSIKMGYHRTAQYLQQISNTTSPSPIDFYISSSANIKPLVSDQYSLGIFKNFNEDLYELSIEGFYKNTQNVIDYRDGVDLFLNKQIEGALTQGKGQSYGLEFYLKKSKGRMDGWISYTYSRSYRLFEGENDLWAINDGNQYRSSFDLPHQLSIVMNYKLARNVIFSTNFTYNTGRPITIPTGKYSYDNFLSVNQYSGRNSFRSPDYHRLDVALTFKGEKKYKKRFRGDLIISIFNVYARKNVYAIFFDKWGQGFKTSVLGTALPSVSYNFNFE